MKRVRFNRGNTESAINAAKRLQSDKTLYIFPTANGLTIEASKPPFGLQHYTVQPDGSVEYIDDEQVASFKEGEEEMKSYTEYAGLYVIDSNEHPGCYLISDAPEHGCNMAPGATYFASKEDALRAIDILKVVDGDGQKFWHLLRAITGHSV